MTAATDTTQDFYWANGRRVPLHRDPKLYAVRFRPGRRDDDETLSPRARRVLRDGSRSVGVVRGHGIQLYEVVDDQSAARAVPELAEDTDPVASRVRVLRDEPSVEFSAPVLRRSPEDLDPIVPTPRMVVSFLPDVSREQIDALNAQYGVRIESQLGYVPNGYVLVAPAVDGEDGSLRLANVYYGSELVEWAMPDLVRRRHTRATATMPEVESDTRHARRGGDLRSQQWHLDHIEVDGAWTVTTGTPSIAVAILDDGIDIEHPEFVGKVTFQWDFEDNDADARPSFSDEDHGTACAGVAVASGVRAFGSAPDCSLMAVRTPFQLGVTAEAEMFRRVADEGADVISCSWGPADGTGAVDPLPDPTRAAIDYCVTQGRGGKGIPIFWAAGNGAESVSADGYASYHRVIAVGACTDQEELSWYSDTGPEVDICAPSNGGTRGILTTDRRGSDGYNSGQASLGDPTGDYTNDFGGTSSATPLAAGVAALVLSVAPDLRWDQVKQILEETADEIGGAGEYVDGHSNRFGHGRVNARRAVEQARGTTGGGSVPTTGGPSIRAPHSVQRSGPPPQFTIDAAGRASMAVEVATEARLFDFPNHGSDRSSSNFYPDWDGGESTTRTSAVTWTLPQHAWDRLRHADALYFRVHVCDDPESWSNYDVSLTDPDASLAPSLVISSGATPGGGSSGGGSSGGGSSGGPGGGSSGGTGGTSGSGGTGGTSAQARLTFPSGATFDTVTAPGDGIDYSDPVANGIVPLIEVAGRLEERLSANFKVREFAARRIGSGALVDHARISVELVERLQQLRERLGRSTIITSGYRYPALNADIGGAPLSQHLTGRAVAIRVPGMAPLQLAGEVLAVFGFDIGIGLGQHSVHVDLRGHLAVFTFDGAELAEAAFESWVNERRGDRSSRTMAERTEAAALDRMVAVTAPSTWFLGAGPPMFRVRPGANPYWGLEVATEPQLLAAAAHRTAANYWRSWDGPLPSAGEREWVDVELAQDAWEQLREAGQLYYRAFTSASAVRAEKVDITTADEDVAGAPSMTLKRQRQRDPRHLSLSDHHVRKVDERNWRRT